MGKGLITDLAIAFFVIVIGLFILGKLGITLLVVVHLFHHFFFGSTPPATNGTVP